MSNQFVLPWIYLLLEPVQCFCDSSKLEAATLRQVHDRHLHWYLDRCLWSDNYSINCMLSTGSKLLLYTVAPSCWVQITIIRLFKLVSRLHRLLEIFLICLDNKPSYLLPSTHHSVHGWVESNNIWMSPLILCEELKKCLICQKPSANYTNFHFCRCMLHVYKVLTTT